MQRLLLILAFVTTTATQVSSQIPTNQDCLGAIVVCQEIFVQNNAFAGTGNYPNEINASLSCLNQGEKNDVWYVFTVQTTGNLSFTITPFGADDYDWALYNLTSATCADIFTNPSLEVSCNYSGVVGPTGANGMPGAQNEPVVPVLVGQTYVLNVSNFSSNQSGYTLDFTASTATIYDTIPPVFLSVTPLNCGDDSLIVTFSENIKCNSVQTTDFYFTNPSGGSIPITSVSSPVCVSGADYSNTYTVYFAPALSVSGLYTFSLVDTVLDVCDNVAAFPADIQVNVAGITYSLSPSNVLCPGGSSGTIAVQNIVGGTGPFTYLWSNGQTGATATGLGVGTYSVTVTPSVGCPAQANTSLTAPAAFNITVTPADATCGLATGSCTVVVNSGGTSPYSYSWSSGSPNSSTANNLAAGNYTVTVTDNNGCTWTSTFTVGNLNGVTAQLVSQVNVLCFGASTGSATAGGINGSGNYNYLWSNAATTNPATNLAAGIFTVTVTDATSGCTSTVSVTITEPATAVALNMASTPTVCGGSNGTATATGSNGTGGYTYLWNNGQTSAAITTLAQGTYTATVTDNNGCTVSATVAVGSSSAPNLNVTNSTNVLCFGGTTGTANLDCPACVGATTYVWSNGATGNSVNNLSAGTYTITVTDANNCTATVTVVITEPTQVSVNAIANDTICSGQSALFNPVANGGTGAYSYLWSNGDPNAALNVAPVSNTTYTLTVTDANNCTATQQATVIVNPPLAVVLSNDTTICNGGTATLTATASGGDGSYTYTWNSGAASGSSINVISSTDTVLNVVVSDGCGSPTVGGSINIFVTKIDIDIINITNAKCNNSNDGSAEVTILSGGVAPFSYQWSNGSTNAVNNNIGAGTYTVTVTDDNGCTQTQTVSITEPTLLTVNIGTNPTICIGQNANLTAAGAGGTAAYSYLWSNGATSANNTVNPIITTNYTVTVTDANNCTVSAMNTVNVYPALSIVSISADTSICKGTSATLSISVTGGNGNYLYDWGGGLVTSTISISPITDTTIYVTVNDNCGTPAVNDSVFIAVIPSPIVDFIWTPDSGCQPLDVTFTDTSITAPGSTYYWDFGDGGSSNLQNPFYTYFNAGLFDVTLTVTTPQGCETTLTKSSIINVYPQPAANFSFTPSQPTLFNPTVEFHDLSSANPNYWFWDLGVNGVTSSVQNPTYTYADTGSYFITLIVRNQFNCIDTIMREVRVIDLFSFFIPNSFTPNNDGKNDKFEVYGLNYSKFTVSIFNRWGQLIHTATSNPVWDGKDFNGDPVQTGAYYYVITAWETFNGKKHEYRGSISLIR